MEEEKKDKDWLDIMAKLLPGIGAIIAGIFIPLVIHINSEKNRSNQLYAEIVSKREIADSELRAKMFENLIKSFFGDTPQKKSDSERLILLRLLALNFHEFFDLKPLFEGLEAEIKDSEKGKLKYIAREVIGKQEAQISNVKEGLSFERTIYEGEENGIMVPPKELAPYRGHRLGISVISIEKNDNFATLSVIDMPEKINGNGIDLGDNVEVKFKLGYYDLPFIDNTKLVNAARFAIVLRDIVRDQGGKKALNIKIIFFPESYMSSRDRPFLDEMIEQLRKRKG